MGASLRARISFSIQGEEQAQGMRNSRCCGAPYQEWIRGSVSVRSISETICEDLLLCKIEARSIPLQE
jgi:hypothetical protein